MKDKLGRLLNCGVGTYKIVMKNKIVTIGCFLIPGCFHLFSPEGSLRWDAMILSLLLALCAAVSIVFVLTNGNATVGKGKKIADDLVQGFFDDKKDSALEQHKKLSVKKTEDDKVSASSKLLDKRSEKILQKQQENDKRNKVIMLIYYILLLAVAVILFVWRDVSIYIAQIVIGGLLIVDGLTGLASVSAARKSNIPVKDNILPLIVNLFTVVLGVLFIVFCWSTAVVTMRISGALLIVKALAEIVVLVRNREVFSSVKDTFNEIKEQ